MGLVTEEFELMWLFESVAAAGDLTLLPLEEGAAAHPGAAAQLPGDRRQGHRRLRGLRRGLPAPTPCS